MAEDCGAVFGDEVAVATILERLLHHSTTVNIRGDSYRLKDKKRAGVFSTPPPMKGASALQVGNLKPFSAIDGLAPSGRDYEGSGRASPCAG